MLEEFSWLVIVVGMISIFKGIENIFPNMARNLLKKRIQQPDYYFRSIGLLLIFLGLTVIYLGVR
ncbi:DUF2065 family protein [archaeon]|nr:DUF2065 family protein [archaeon]